MPKTPPRSAALTTIPTAAPDPETTAQRLRSLERLRAVHRGAYLTYALATAEVLVQDWFDGDVSHYTNRDPAKTASFEAFTRAHPQELADLNLGKEMLKNYLRAYAVAPSLSAEVRERLEVTKMAKLVGVASPAVRQRLGAEAVEAGWTRDQLTKAVRKATGKKPSKAKGRPAHPALLKAVLAAKEAAQKVGKHRTAYEDLAPTHRSMASAALVDAIAELQQVLVHVQLV